MRLAWLVLTPILTACASLPGLEPETFYLPTSVEIKRAKPAPVSFPGPIQVDDSELRIGFIEPGRININQMQSEFKHIEFIQSGSKPLNYWFKKDLAKKRNDSFQEHAHLVILSFLKNLKTNKKVKVYSCSIGAYEINYIEKCWTWMKAQKVQAVNSSYQYAYSSPKENKLIQELISQKVAVVFTAGNEHTFAAGQCSMFKGIYCVGALRKNQPAEYSNYGPLVNAWSDGDFTWKNEFHFGTSIAAPRFIAEQLSVP